MNCDLAKKIFYESRSFFLAFFLSFLIFSFFNPFGIFTFIDNDISFMLFTDVLIIFVVLVFIYSRSVHSTTILYFLLVIYALIVSDFIASTYIFISRYTLLSILIRGITILSIVFLFSLCKAEVLSDCNRSGRSGRISRIIFIFFAFCSVSISYFTGKGLLFN